MIMLLSLSKKLVCGKLGRLSEFYLVLFSVGNSIELPNCVGNCVWEESVNPIG